jgi:hypothetical protein
MTQLLVWILMAYGMTNIVVYGSIFNEPRDFIKKWSEDEFAPFQGVGQFISKMISCPMCFGTWFGFFAGAFLYSPTYETLGIIKTFSWFFDGMLASGGVWVVNSIIEWFEQNRPQPPNVL